MYSTIVVAKLALPKFGRASSATTGETDMKGSISFSRKEESLAAKARWFQKKTIAERLVAAFEWLDFIRLISPKKVFYEDAHKTFRSFRVLEPRRR